MTSKAIALPFSINEVGGINYATTEAKIWQDRVLIVVMTNLNERVMNPTFGGNVGLSLFQNINDAMTVIQQSISLAFSRWLLPLTLISVSGYIDPIEARLVLEVNYKLRDSDNGQSVTIKTAILSRAGDVLLEVRND
jgi:phage baseplate assembly protein W